MLKIQIDTLDALKCNKDYISTIVKLSAINYSVTQIANYFNISVLGLKELVWDKETEVSKAFNRGLLQAKAEINLASLQSAKGGNVSQIVRIDKEIKHNSFLQLKDKLLNGEF